MARVWAALALGLQLARGSTGPCKKHSVDFILLEGDSLSAKIEDDIKKDLEKVGFTVNTRLIAKDAFNTAMTSGDFNLCFTESWGPPYDPHSYAASWFVPDEAHFKALEGMLAPNTKAVMQKKVSDVLKVENLAQRQTQWTEILQAFHEQAISNPMWSRTMPAVIAKRLSGYEPGLQQFEYPVHRMSVMSGPTTVTLAPGSQQGVFGSAEAVPRNDPHSYRPNEFFINDWIYEGLVSYGKDGLPIPSLATAWTVTDSGSGQVYRFTLRSGVTFHDGTPFNCAAVKMTFDHALVTELKGADWHGWYQMPAHLTSWSCDGEVFVATLSDVYYPFLQELTFIRPIRILSPNCYADGPGSSPTANNSCPTGWSSGLSTITCGGTICSAGTGPWKLMSTTTTADGKKVKEMSFAKHAGWWGTRGNIEKVVVKGYENGDAVKVDLDSGALDMMVGGGVLTPVQVRDYAQNHTDKFQVSHGPPLMNSIVVMNSNKAPTDDLQVRKVIMHAVNKAAIVETELAGSRVVAHSLFPTDAPYCNVPLSPRWDYDLEKAQLLNCPLPPPTLPPTPAPTPTPPVVSTAAPTVAAVEEKDNTGLVLGICLGVGIPLMVIVAAIAFFVGKKAGYEQMGGPKADPPPTAPAVVGTAAEPAQA